MNIVLVDKPIDRRNARWRSETGKMKILLPVIGTRGDNQLFLALAKALTDVGHETTVALTDKYVALANSYGIRTSSLGGSPDEGVAEIREMMRASNTLKAV